MISITENSAQQVRPAPVVFPQGQMSLPLVEASTARLLNLSDGQVVQGTVQAQGDQLALLLRGRLLELPPGMEWTIGQRLNLRAQTNPHAEPLAHAGPGQSRWQLGGRNVRFQCAIRRVDRFGWGQIGQPRCGRRGRRPGRVGPPASQPPSTAIQRTCGHAVRPPRTASRVAKPGCTAANPRSTRRAGCYFGPASAG